MDRKMLPLGISDYRELISGNYYYVDKTDFIREILEEGAIATLFPRPRRFGKTLNLSMLRYFFEQTDGNSCRPLFEGMKIEQWKGFEQHQGKYPVIFLTLKDCKADTYEGILRQIALAIQQEYRRHEYLLEGIRSESSRKTFRELLEATADELTLQTSLFTLIELLFMRWGVKPVVLLDEYDSPVHEAYNHGCYEKAISFMRGFMSRALKDNPNYFRAVITGILRVSRESLFSGLNNIIVRGILNEKMADHFGFTQPEVDRMLDYYGLGDTKQEVKNWYDGYIFGEESVYNPWSVLSFVNEGGRLDAYWVNTSADLLLRHLFAEGPYNVRAGIERLMQGDTIRSVINDKVAFPDLLSSAEYVWSFLLFCGYLKAYDPEINSHYLTEYTLQIPNREVYTVYSTVIRNWINDSPVKNDRLGMMLQALRAGDLEYFEESLNDFVVNTLSFYDTNGREPEKVYQAFLLGLLANMSDYEVSSNRESGFGRYDILLRPKDGKGQAVVMELKRLRKSETVEKALDSALRQIEEKQYAAALRHDGFTDILRLAITFDGKQVWVKTA